MDKASKIAQEAVHLVMEHSRMSNPPTQVGPMDYEAAFAEKLRKYFPETRRPARRAPAKAEELDQEGDKFRKAVEQAYQQGFQAGQGLKG